MTLRAWQVMRLDPYFVNRYVRMAEEAEARQQPVRAAELYRVLECLPLDGDQRAWLQAREAALM